VKKFLFIIPQSPASSLTPFRRSLTEVSMWTLKNQTSSDWEALLIGEEEKTEGNLHYVRSPFKTKEEKLHFVVDRFLNARDLPEYFIRLDDDDLISPLVLDKVSRLEFDCYADHWHCFYDLSTGRISQQKRSWLPNTVIHKTEHALAEYGEYHYVVHSDLRRPHLLQNDHSKWWHQYYAGKKTIFAPKGNPFYIRVLSPTSYTASGGQYDHYLEKFGKWDSPVPEEYREYIDELKKIWIASFGNLNPAKKNILKSMIAKLKNYF